MPTLTDPACGAGNAERIDIELRNRALIAFTTGARDGTIASLKLKHADVEQGAAARCAGGAHQILKDHHDVVFPRRR